MSLLLLHREIHENITNWNHWSKEHLDWISYVSTENRNVTTAITQRNITNWNHWNKEYLDWISYISTGNRNVRADIKVWECYYIF